jgi:hypothetical protein
VQSQERIAHAHARPVGELDALIGPAALGAQQTVLRAAVLVNAVAVTQPAVESEDPLLRAQGTQGV